MTKTTGSLTRLPVHRDCKSVYRVLPIFVSRSLAYHDRGGGKNVSLVDISNGNRFLLDFVRNSHWVDTNAPVVVCKNVSLETDSSGNGSEPVSREPNKPVSREPSTINISGKLVTYADVVQGENGG